MHRRITQGRLFINEVSRLIWITLNYSHSKDCITAPHKSLIPPRLAAGVAQPNIVPPPPAAQAALLPEFAQNGPQPVLKATDQDQALHVVLATYFVRSNGPDQLRLP